MKSVLQFFAKRRFNYLDMVFLFAVVDTWQAGHILSGLALLIVGIVLSIWAERKAGA
jgi:hypothetical protein